MRAVARMVKRPSTRLFAIAGVVALAIALIVLVALGVVPGRSSEAPSSHGRTGSARDPNELPVTPSGLDPLVEEFRATERTCLQRYNTALREQRENKIDELELSNRIELEVLQPWRSLRAKVGAAPPQDELYATLRRYLEARQISWEAYVTALRAPSDDAARAHYETHRQKNAEAQDYARELGRLFREAAARANPR
jgi:hypothetical protein